jgi:hypothetical protein
LAAVSSLLEPDPDPELEPLEDDPPEDEPPPLLLQAAATKVTAPRHMAARARRAKRRRRGLYGIVLGLRNSDRFISPVGDMSVNIGSLGCQGFF